MVWLVKCVLTAMAGLMLFLQLGLGARKQHRSQLLLSLKHSEMPGSIYRSANLIIPLASCDLSFSTLFSNFFPKRNLAQFPSYKCAYIFLNNWEFFSKFQFCSLIVICIYCDKPNIFLHRENFTENF